MKIAELKETIEALGDHDYEDADEACFQHLKDVTKEFGGPGKVAAKLLALAQELMQ